MSDFNSKAWRRLVELTRQGQAVVDNSTGTEGEREAVLSIICKDIETTIKDLRKAHFRFADSGVVVPLKASKNVVIDTQ